LSNKKPITKPPQVIQKGPLKKPHSFLHLDEDLSSSGWSHSEDEQKWRVDKNKY